MKIMTLLLLLISYVQICFAGVKLEAVYPYSLDKKGEQVVYEGSTMPFYLNLTSFDLPEDEPVSVKVTFPEGFACMSGTNFQATGNVAAAKFLLNKNFAHSFDLLYVEANGKTFGSREALVEITGPTYSEKRTINFTYVEPDEKQKALVQKEKIQQQASASSKKKAKRKIDNKRFNWYIQSVTIPVDNQGLKNDKEEAGVLYVRDTSLESFRNRMTGGGATNWSAVFNHPACHLLLDMRNPQRDIRVLKFKAELINKQTGENVPGLITAGKTNSESENGWAGEMSKDNESTALISLDGKKSQTFILPIYVDYFTILEGDYTLRVTVEGNGQKKIQENPLTISKRHSLGLLAVAFSFLCLLIVFVCAYKIKDTIYQIGAKGAITVALFATIAFGGITLPTTIIGDFIHALLGPFSGLVTGLLSGIFQYLLIVSLLVLYRKPGVVSLLFFVKFMLNGVMFGHFTPLGMLSLSVSVVALEVVLYSVGFFKKKTLSKNYMLLVALALGLCDALTTFVNLEQMMFFYRLFYADWYISLYMLVNGLLYSSIGALLGFKTGNKLKQVMGE
ncbi:MAG: hypothetical protein Q4D21_01950 [Phascolarctobacterium sp.]|nr:hypothetical protein [Phascolarctobacterium sp.]